MRAGRFPKSGLRVNDRKSDDTCEGNLGFCKRFATEPQLASDRLQQSERNG
jgi:hypothetical protein